MSCFCCCWYSSKKSNWNQSIMSLEIIQTLQLLDFRELITCQTTAMETQPRCLSGPSTFGGGADDILWFDLWLILSWNRAKQSAKKANPIQRLLQHRLNFCESLKILIFSFSFYQVPQIDGRVWLSTRGGGHIRSRDVIVRVAWPSRVDIFSFWSNLWLLFGRAVCCLEKIPTQNVKRWDFSSELSASR